MASPGSLPVKVQLRHRGNITAIYLMTYESMKTSGSLGSTPSRKFSSTRDAQPLLTFR